MCVLVFVCVYMCVYQDRSQEICIGATQIKLVAPDDRNVNQKSILFMRLTIWNKFRNAF